MDLEGRVSCIAHRMAPDDVFQTYYRPVLTVRDAFRNQASVKTSVATVVPISTE